MWHARFDITCDPWVDGFNHAIWVILGAHLLHLVLLGDFGYYYVKPGHPVVIDLLPGR